MTSEQDKWQAEANTLREQSPRGLLFLCVANSARSQIAEGIARSLAPAGIQVWSAGSRPTGVRPEAIAVLEEIGIDISHHRSKAVSEIPADQVDTVITLCGEEECPLFLGQATRLHWGLPDPAAVQGSEQDRLNAFRATRDELRRRLEAFLAGKDEGDHL
jgi:thioredoxin type arsenate reductase